MHPLESALQTPEGKRNLMDLMELLNSLVDKYGLSYLLEDSPS